MTNSSLLSYVQRQLESLPGNLFFRLDELLVNYKDEKKIFCSFQRSHPTFQARLILLSQCTSPSEQAFVPTHALLAHEYISASCHTLTHSYIQYIDTTGFFSPRQHQSSVTVCFVQAYIQACLEFGVQFVHITSHAKPEYFFTYSERNEGKKPLSAARLVKWWINTLSTIPSVQFTKDDDDNNNKQFDCFYYCPTISEEESKRDIGDHENKKWTIGYPYIQNESAEEHIPAFNDDPIYEHFKTMLHKDIGMKKVLLKADIVNSDSKELSMAITVKEFFESMACRPEFNQKTAFFVVKNMSNTHSWIVDGKSANGDPLISMEMVFKAIARIEYKDSESFQKSCKNVLDLIEGPSTSRFKTKDLPFIEKKIIESTIPINPIQSLVKRKKIQ